MPNYASNNFLRAGENPLPTYIIIIKNQTIMETTNEGMSIKEKTLKFMEIAFEIAVEIGENEVNIKYRDGKMYGEIQTKQEINLHRVAELTGEISCTIITCDYGLELLLSQKL